MPSSIFMVGGGLVTKLCPTLVTPRTVARQAPLSLGFSRQELWSGLPLLKICILFDYKLVSSDFFFLLELGYNIYVFENICK